VIRRPWGILNGVSLFLFAVASLCAQRPEFEGKPIARIELVQSGILDPTDLAKSQPLRVGQPLRSEEVAHAIDGLFATGRFEDIEVRAELEGDGVVVRFVTKNTWFISGVSVRGKAADPPGRGEIATTAQLSLGAPFRDEDLQKAQQNIHRLLEANGLYEAEVEPTVERDDKAQQVLITFNLRSGKRAKYEEPVIEGDTKLSDDTVLRVTGWRIPVIHWWRRVTASRTHKGVHNLLAKYQKEDRLMARVELTNLDYNADRRRVRPNLDVHPGPKVEVKTIETKLSKRVLKRYVPVFQEGSVDNDLLVEGKRNLEDYLQSQGYYDVDVEFRVPSPKDDVQTIEYVISRGRRFKLAHIAIAGNKYFDKVDIRQRMFMQPATFYMRHGRYSEAFRRRDEEDITNLYLANGFRDVKVHSMVQRDYRAKAGEMGVTVQIEEGTQWFVDDLTLQGVSQAMRDQVASGLVSVAGQPFAEANIAADRSTVLTYYYSHGFPAAQFQASWQPSGIPRHVKLTYTIQEGDRQYVREVITSGLRITRQSLVDNNITLKPGDPLSPIEETEIQKRFYQLGIFASVDTAIENPDGATDHKYVLYNFDEANRYTFAVGVGAQVARFGTPSTTDLSAPGGTTGFSPQVSFDVNRLNFLGVGHTISFRSAYSSIEKRASISYLQPRLGNVEGRNITYSVLFDNTLDVRTFAAKREEASIQLSQKFSKSLNGLFQFAYRRVSVSSIVIPALLIPQLVQPVRIGILSARLIQDRRDNPADPHRGIYNTADLGVASSIFGSQRSFGRVLLRNATYYRVTNNIVLARQTQFGVIAPFSAPSGISEQESVPLPERFFAGGADSLRAFPYNQAGPRDTGAPLELGGPASRPTGFPLGGNALFVNNVELRFPLIGENIQGVLFHDMGNVYSSVGNISLRFHQRNDQDFDYAVHAAGFGIRYRTPIGPVRADLAYSINPPSFVGFKGTPSQLLQCNPNLSESMLPSFCQGVPQSISHFQFFFSIGQAF
jgi:outer membrane protein insertion porin family